MWNWYWPKHQHSAFSIRLWRASPITIFIMEAKVIITELKRGLFSIYLKATSSPFKFFLVLFKFSLCLFTKKYTSMEGWAGIPVSRDSREYKPQISLPFPWHFVISLPVPGKRKFWPGIKTGNTIIICSFADGWWRHENKSNLELNLAFYMIPRISRDSWDYEAQTQ